MFKDDYKASFSNVRASEATYRRIMNMTKQKKTRARRGVVGKLLIAAAILSTMVLTVSAAEMGWFRGYFEKQSDEPLSQGQIDYIEQNEQHINESQMEGGYTLEVKSAISDGWAAYITVGITGPEDAVLNKTVIPGYSTDKPNITPASLDNSIFQPASGEDFMGGVSLNCEEDNDGRDNTQNWVLTLEPNVTADGEMPFAPGRVWKLHVEDLVAEYFDKAYMDELAKGKYQGEEGFGPTDEEWKKLCPRVTLATGVWDFDITFDESGFRSVELIDKPVTASVATDWKEMPDGNYEEILEDVKITSFALRTLSATVLIDGDASPNFPSLFAVLKNGMQVELRLSSAVPGQARFMAERPILLDEVDHILMHDGSKIPML